MDAKERAENIVHNYVAASTPRQRKQLVEEIARQISEAEREAYREGTDHPGIAEALRKNYEAGYQDAKEQAAKILHRAVHDYLGMDNSQKAYSWHDVEDALESASSKIRAMSPRS